MIYKRDNAILFWSTRGPIGIYSQWYKKDITINGQTYCCNEQYMMYQKAILFKDFDIANQILQTNKPKEIKALGRKVKNFDAKIWNQHKENIVYQANLAKFSQHEDLKKVLLDSNDKLIVEASPMDCIWGVGLAAEDDRILDTDKWEGQNLLGKAIMKVREELRGIN